LNENSTQVNRARKSLSSFRSSGWPLFSNSAFNCVPLCVQRL
jgi:hypothetical protein